MPNDAPTWKSIRSEAAAIPRSSCGTEFASEALIDGRGHIFDWEEAAAKEEETFVQLPREIPVRLVYQTAFLDGGRIRFRPDVYGWDDVVARHGRIDIVAGVVRQPNFPSYPLVRLADSPRIETPGAAASTRNSAVPPSIRALTMSSSA